jgi:hypothetical protein
MKKWNYFQELLSALSFFFAVGNSIIIACTGIGTKSIGDNLIYGPLAIGLLFTTLLILTRIPNFLSPIKIHGFLMALLVGIVIHHSWTGTYGGSYKENIAAKNLCNYYFNKGYLPLIKASIDSGRSDYEYGTDAFQNEFKDAYWTYVQTKYINSSDEQRSKQTMLFDEKWGKLIEWFGSHKEAPPDGTGLNIPEILNRIPKE